MSASAVPGQQASAFRLTRSSHPEVLTSVLFTMNQFTTSLNGLEIGLRPGYDLPPAESALLYMNKPLPPLPKLAMPAMRIPRKPVGSGDSRLRKTTSRQPCVRDQLLPPRSFQELPPLRAPSSSLNLQNTSNTQHRSSHSAQQTCWRDSDFSDGYSNRQCTSVRVSISPCSSKKNSESYDAVTNNPYSSSLRHESSTLPALEPDVDGISSKNSSWGPVSPRPAAIHISEAASSRRSNDSRYDAMSLSPKIMFEDNLPNRWDLYYSGSADARATGEFHDSSADLEVYPTNSANDKTALLQVPTFQSPSSEYHDFLTTPRRRNMPQSIDSSASWVSQAQRTPYPHKAFFASQLELTSAPRSAFDTDSDSDDASSTHGMIRDLFRSSSADRRGSMDLLMPRQTRRQSDGLLRPAFRSRHISGLFASAKELWQVSKTDKRKEGLRKHIKVLPTEDDVQGPA